MTLANEVLNPSPLVLLTLVVILGASVGIFAALVRRETRHRRAVALALWARSRNLRVEGGATRLPELALLDQFKPKVKGVIRGQSLTLAKIETADVGVTAGVLPPREWNLIFRKLSGAWPATALRPTSHTVSAVDLFSLSSYPSLMPTERFMVFGVESRAAQALAESPAAALLPGDVGLIVYADYLILDFSGRPFDEIEFDRVIELAEELAPRLIPPK